MRKLIFILLIGPLFCSCDRDDRQYFYPESDKFSNSNGDPLDSFAFFFPTELNYSDTSVKTELDTFRLKWYSSQIYSSKEKILFNHYLGHDQYRFAWLRSFHLPVFISLHKERDSVWLTIKKLDRHPRFVGTVIRHLPPEDERQNVSEPKQYIPPSLYAELLIDSSKILTLEEWNSFEKILSSCGFWEMTPTLADEVPGVDGSEWIIEAHLKSKYWLVDRWSPKNNYKDAGEYLIRLSGLDVEIY